MSSTAMLARILRHPGGSLFVERKCLTACEDFMFLPMALGRAGRRKAVKPHKYTESVEDIISQRWL